MTAEELRIAVESTLEQMPGLWSVGTCADPKSIGVQIAATPTRPSKAPAFAARPVPTTPMHQPRPSVALRQPMPGLPPRSPGQARPLVRDKPTPTATPVPRRPIDPAAGPEAQAVVQLGNLLEHVTAITATDPAQIQLDVGAVERAIKTAGLRELHLDARKRVGSGDGEGNAAAELVELAAAQLRKCGTLAKRASAAAEDVLKADVRIDASLRPLRSKAAECAQKAAHEQQLASAAVNRGDVAAQRQHLENAKDHASAAARLNARAGSIEGGRTTTKRRLADDLTQAIQEFNTQVADAQMALDKAWERVAEATSAPPVVTSATAEATR